MKLRSKSLRLKNDKPKVGLIIGIVALALVLVLVVLSAVQCSKDKKEEEAKGKEIEGIAIAFRPDKTTYYVGEEFDPVGTQVQVITNSQEYTHFVDWNQLTFEGFDSSVANDKVTITVSYQGYTTKFDVAVKEPQLSTPTLVGIEVYNFETTYSKSEWNTYGPKASGGRIRCIYSDGSVVEDIVLKSKYIYGVVESDVGTTEITVKYSDGVTTVELPITITITKD